MIRLNYRYTRAYSWVTFFVLLIGCTIVYNAVKRSYSQATIGELKNLNKIIATQIESKKNYANHESRTNVVIELLKSKPKNFHEIVIFKKVWNKELQDHVTNVELSTFHKINNQNYKISSHTFMIIADEIYLNGIFMVFAWTFIFLISMVIITSEIISGYILSPFNATLQSIQKFTINQKAAIKFEKTSTQEFQELNSFLEKMTDKAKKDYTVLKEFSENASHELQTPIAVIKAKIELLLQTPLDEQQLIKLTSMLDELEKLSKINQSLTLLTKLENFENKNHHFINFSTILEETIDSFADLIEMKPLNLKSVIAENVIIHMDETLCRILLNNLFSNAIRHNSENGIIGIALTDAHFIIKNTGKAPLVPTEELFGRFKKDNQSINSIGIGLAIVKKITEIFNHAISYQYISSYHILKIEFSRLK